MELWRKVQWFRKPNGMLRISWSVSQHCFSLVGIEERRNSSPLVRLIWKRSEWRPKVANGSKRPTKPTCTYRFISSECARLAELTDRERRRYWCFNVCYPVLGTRSGWTNPVTPTRTWPRIEKIDRLAMLKMKKHPVLKENQVSSFTLFRSFNIHCPMLVQVNFNNEWNNWWTDRNLKWKQRVKRCPAIANWNSRTRSSRHEWKRVAASRCNVRVRCVNLAERITATRSKVAKRNTLAKLHQRPPRPELRKDKMCFYSLVFCSIVLHE